ncbi:MAG: hypothetical protein KF905_09000 [Flavobacteriales bacterium]|nr:hypothetical protein [Flavobacteriales bacterium]
MRFLEHSLLIALLLLVHPLNAQHTMPDPDQILIGSDPLPQVLLLGTFHFGYPDLDAHVTAEDDRVDVLSPERQQELSELLDVVMRFKPTKLCVETQGGWLMHEYSEYRRGERKLGRNEFYQIGFRMMDRAKLDTMYAVDAAPLSMQLYYGPDSLYHRPWLDTLYGDWDFGGEDEISKRYSALYTAMDKAKKHHTLLEIFLAMNDDHALDRDYGAYLNGWFKMPGHNGADVHAIHWYSRNLRIFRNIQDITTGPEDRILVVFGAGHMGILKHLFACSPEYQLVRLKDLVP